MTPLLAQRGRSDRGFERLYKRHVGDVYRYALAVMRNPTDAEDVTQTTFLNAYRAYVEKGSRPEKPQNWLIAIAHNVCRQRFRQTSRRPAEVSFEDDIADTVADDEALTGEDIRRALSHLAFNQRAALVMRELEGRSYAEIADILQVSTSAVETLIFRARRALREQLEGSLSCGEAEFAISRQLDGRLPRRERGQLRAHLRECGECAGFARRQRAQRGALKTLALVPIPTSLTSLFGGGGGAAAGGGVALKAAAAVTAGLAIGGAGYEGVRHVPWHAQKPVASAPQKAVAADAASNSFVVAPGVRPDLTSRVSPGKKRNAAKARHTKRKRVKGLGAKSRAGHSHSTGPVKDALPRVSPAHAPHGAHAGHGTPPARRAKLDAKRKLHRQPVPPAGRGKHN
jgi:RNA polymerase sigma-70 factor (ECF subfamily)